MPGLTLLYDKNDISSLKPIIFETLLNNENRKEYMVKVFHEEETSILLAHAYPQYPVNMLETQQYLTVIEGKFYGLSHNQISEKINELYLLIFNNDNINKSALANCLLSIDGEFVIFMKDKCSGRMVIINDVFGRLPLYYNINHQYLILSREQRLIANCASLNTIDKLGAASFMLFGYTFGERTLLKECKYFLPGSFILIDENNQKIRLDRYYIFDFQMMIKGTIDYQKEVIELVDLFRVATHIRQGNKTLIGLSGGLDSRSIAAAINKDNRNILAVTRLSPNKREINDLKFARLVAEEAELPFEVIETNPFCGKELEELLNIKMGLNSLENGFNILYEKIILERFGNDLIYLTGDGGDRIKPHIKSLFRVRDINQLTCLVLENNAVLNSDIVFEILNVPKAEIIEELIKYLNECPEKDWLHKYIHFMVYESAFKYVFEGEDRKRHFFWATTPFYSPGFFMKAMSIPDNHKKNYKLYKDFMIFLNKDLAKINNADWGFPINSLRRSKFYLLKSTYNLIPLILKSAIIKCIKVKKKTNNPNLLRLVNHLSKLTKEKPSIFSEPTLVFRYLDYVNDATLFKIITPVLLYHYLQGDNLLKREYYDVPFI